MSNKIKAALPIILVIVFAIGLATFLWLRNENSYTKVTIDTANICNGFETEVASQLETKKIKKSELQSYTSELKARHTCFTIEK